MTTPPQDPYGYPIFGNQPQPGPAQQPPTIPTEQATPPRQRRRWPWVVGIVAALFLGVGIGAAGEDPPPAAATDNDQEVTRLQASLDDTQEQLANVGEERDAALDDLHAVEDARDTALADLETAQADLSAAEDERDAAITRAEEAESELAGVQEAAAEAEAAGTRFGDGTWVIGEDIEAGTYRNDGGSWCYWERLSGLSGEFGDIIANGLPDGQAVVEIASSDAAFSSNGCGTWTRQ